MLLLMFTILVVAPSGGFSKRFLEDLELLAQ